MVPRSSLQRLHARAMLSRLLRPPWSDPPDEMRRALLVLAENFVHSHREEIETLATVLDERRSLPRAEIEEIFGSAGQ
ncbi:MULTISPECIES: hypothetical protein [Rhizobium]|uniref:hypothetical protein n=1 Tax=Rhizobium TaxID=379 RepID=UPI0007EAA23D|nr:MULTISPECIES: hypothetical protein [Rhizobium]ANK91570.1 hypothetical protein AMK01_CH02111 [Rhizobium sp. N6212]ANK97603.1 hypothetical protein AMK00_CH02113 [Rhizobium sp. N621]ANL03683.1 hypothetical protein AMJ99_CH02141 [Rhizobium esperanzae]ANL09729.1 hypothetical protein AMJ98_CH02063 [Rhizobium sp. N1341]ANL21780.1 hypothetical protein AMJ96_CH02069 [Rhizobium sp. N113]